MYTCELPLWRKFYQDIGDTSCLDSIGFPQFCYRVRQDQCCKVEAGEKSKKVKERRELLPREQLKDEDELREGGVGEVKVKRENI